MAGDNGIPPHDVVAELRQEIASGDAATSRRVETLAHNVGRVEAAQCGLHGEIVTLSARLDEIAVDAKAARAGVDFLRDHLLAATVRPEAPKPQADDDDTGIGFRVGLGGADLRALGGAFLRVVAAGGVGGLTLEGLRHALHALGM